MNMKRLFLALILMCSALYAEEFLIKTGNSFNVKSQKDGNVEIVTNAGPCKGFSARFNDVDIKIAVNVNGDKVDVQIMSGGEKKTPLNIDAKNWSADNLAKGIITSISQQNSSMTVEYSYDSQVSESSQNGSITNITRKFSEKKRNWYVLSEAVYDDGFNKISKLDDPKFVSKLNERYDCTSFAKSSRLAKFMKFESTQNYQLVSEHNYTPSLATPLYESVLLVKIDKMDNVTEKVYLGKFKING